MSHPSNRLFLRITQLNYNEINRASSLASSQSLLPVLTSYLINEAERSSFRSELSLSI